VHRQFFSFLFLVERAATARHYPLVRTRVWLQPDTTEAKRLEIETGSRDLAKLPGVRNLVVGNAVPSDRALVDDSFDFALSMQFASEQSMNAYIVHPDHQRYVGELKPHIAKILVYDIR
jgi:hypothetical protein